MLKFSFLFFIIAASIFAQENRQTEFEKSGCLKTSNYEETIDYFKRLSDSPMAELRVLGESPQGRELYYFIVSKDQIFEVEEVKKSGKAIVLIENGIHSGEIEGKDACMILLRDILVSKTKEYLIDNAVLIVVPVFNVDGHERSSPFSRINQNGPEEMGWRVTAQNLNLNRDFVKADAPEMKALLNLFNKWLPDLFIDTHTTDGLDYQYTITYGIETHQNMVPKTTRWIETELIPHFTQKLEQNGYLISKYVGVVDGNLHKGIRDWVAGPRFSNGYAAAQNRPGLLIETHMLKPYKDRVYSTMYLIEGALEKVNEQSGKLIKLNNDADDWAVQNYAINKDPFPIEFKSTNDFEMFKFLGIENSPRYGKIAGDTIPFYTGEKIELEIPYYNKVQVTKSVYAASAYIIPQEWSKLCDILRLHGVKIEQLKKEEKMIVEKIKFKEVKFADSPYEGRFRVNFKYDSFIDTITVKAGDYLVDAKQRSIGLIIHLLEPDAPDSFVKWGFMNQIFEYKEYFETYSMEPIAERMAEEYPELYTEFKNKVEEDENFRNNPRARLNFFYKNSNYYDENYMMYPVFKVIKVLN